MHSKPHLPQKTGVNCRRPFAWRRKWRLFWEEVRYCSERCRRTHHRREVSGAEESCS
ncbi:DUF2256 domain-containing protein [Marinobacterium aestuariivivens]|uniref:DUF2256 domain-containing protein n=1 Tax=Marinobacterium aestuariivivens TaxID=1698799 RepID=A0ABW2A260_9GAMM